MDESLKEKILITAWIALPPVLLGSFIFVAMLFSGSRVSVTAVFALLIEASVIGLLGFAASPLFSEIVYRDDPRDQRVINGEKFAKKFMGGALVGFLFSLASCYICTFYEPDWQQAGMAAIIYAVLVIVLTTGFYSVWPFTLKRVVG